jgi:DNA processing protein
MKTDTFYLLALAGVKHLGPVSARNLIAYCGSARAVFELPKSRLMRVPGIGGKLIGRIRSKETLLRAEEALKACEAQGIRPTGYLSPAYPQLLKNTYDSPLILFQQGPLDLNAQPNLAIVGTRKATGYGKQMAERFARHFAARGINVVSGLAYGIDITAHRASLQADGLTTAVLAHGLEQVYPREHSQKAREIARKGALLSEYLPGSPIDPGNFPARNRIIAGLCRAVIVIEAAQKGGALITARFAFDQSREVYALPGRVGDTYSQGCLHLIRDQVARLVTDPEEVLQDLEIRWNESDEAGRQLDLELEAPVLAASPEEQKVLDFLTRGEAQIDSIAMHTRLPIAQLNPLILGMEFRGLVRQMPGKKYRKL